MLKKVTGWLHLWLGLISGIIVFIVSLTGCVYVFHEEFRQIFPPARIESTRIDIPSEGRPLLMPSEIVRRVERSEHGDSVRINPFMMRYLRDQASILLSGEVEQDRTWYLVDPYTGEVLEQKREMYSGTYLVKNGQIQGENLEKFDFFAFVLDGHMTLWLPVKIGKILVTYGTLVFVVLLISGLILWWPKNKSAAKQRYWFQWKKSTKWRRKNYDLHNIAGFYMFAFLLLIGLTGVAMGIEWANKSLHWVFSGGVKEKEIESVPPENPALIPDFNTTLDHVLKQELAKHPDAGTYSMYWSYPSRDIPTSVIRVVAYMKSGSQVSLYDRYSMQLLGLEEHDEESLAHEIEELYLPIHEGSIWGLPTKILAFLASLVATTLPVTGFCIWWGRREKKGKKGNDKARHKASRVSAAEPQSVSNSRARPVFKPRSG
ncbi:MAG: hypothetical protein ABS46_11065 [Cytophagaceae bacterium SCN 52-12]|nr:MAG: hypothetical protein ABS46_11065 [Cytophagaceae bacterium SCN 52-12]